MTSFCLCECLSVESVLSLDIKSHLGKINQIVTFILLFITSLNFSGSFAAEGW